MRALFKNSVSIGLTEILLILVIIIKNKYLAISIGSAGFGLYGILSSFFGIFFIISGTWVGTAATKYISESNNNDLDSENKINIIFSFVFYFTLTVGILISILLIFFSNSILLNFFPHQLVEAYYQLFCIGFITMNIQPVLLSIIQGILNVKTVITTRIINSVMDVVLIIFFVYMFQVLGFFIGIVISSIFSASILFYFLTVKCGFKLVKFSIQDEIVKKILFFGLINLALGLINIISMYVQRNIILSKIDIKAVGIFQAGFMFMNYLGVLSRGSSFHFLPTISKNVSVTTKNNLLNEFIFFTLISTCTLFVASILFGNYGISILYSKDFNDLKKILFFFILAQFVSQILTPFQLTLLGMTKLKAHLFITFIIHSFWIIIPYIFIEKFGLVTLPLGMLFGYLVGIILYALYLKKESLLTIDNKNVYLFIFSVLLLTISLFLLQTNFFMKILYSLVSTLAIFLFLNKEQKIVVKNLIEISIKKIKISNGDKKL